MKSSVKFINERMKNTPKRHINTEENGEFQFRRVERPYEIHAPPKQQAVLNFRLYLIYNNDTLLMLLPT